MKLENYELNLKCSLEKLKQYGRINGGGVYSIEYAEGNEDYYSYYGRGLFEYKFTTCNDFLNDEVEIIEEPKKIEKLNTNIINANRYDFDKNKEMTISNITADILSISKVINELIDEINNLKEK